MEKKEEEEIIAVHSLVILSISDHYVRLKINGDGKEACAFGGVMGAFVEGRTEIVASFELPLENGAVDAEFVKARADQCRQVSPGCDLAGFYAVAPVSEALKTQLVLVGRQGFRRPLLLVLNPADARRPVKGDAFPVSAYSMSPDGVFERQILKVVSDEPERIGIEHIVRYSDNSKQSQCKKRRENQWECLCAFIFVFTFIVKAHLSGLESSLEILYQKVLDVCKQAEQMASGEIPYNCDFIRKAGFLSKMLPTPSSPSFRQKLSDVNNIHKPPNIYLFIYYSNRNMMMLNWLLI